MLRDWTLRIPRDGIDIPGLPALDPLLSITVDELPNLNDMLYMSPRPRSFATKNARNRGYRIGLDAARTLGLGVVVKQVPGAKSLRAWAKEMSAAPLSSGKIFTILNVWLPRQTKGDVTKSKRKRDVYNPMVKALIDGLTDAGLWEDDNTEYHTDFWVRYRGLADTTQMEIIFYAY